jgi:hypothetical protein
MVSWTQGSTPTPVTEQMLFDNQLVVPTQSLFDVKLWIIFNRLSHCQVPIGAILSSYGAKVIIMFIVNVLIASKVQDIQFIQILKNYVVIIAEKLISVGGSWDLMSKVYKLFVQTLVSILIEYGNLPEHLIASYTVAEQTAINMVNNMFSSQLITQASNLFFYALSGQMQAIMECYGNIPGNTRFYEIAYEVCKAIDVDNTNKVKDPWRYNQSVKPWGLQGVLSLTSSTPIAFGYITGLGLVLSRFALRCYVN